MKIKLNRQYEDLATEYQFQLIKLLDDALKESSLNLDQRQDICERFMFDMGMLQDQGTIIAKGRPYQPMIAFVDSEEVRITDGEFDLHEYAFGNVAEYFESLEDRS